MNLIESSSACNFLHLPTDENRKMVLSIRKYVCSLAALAHSITDLEIPLYYA